MNYILAATAQLARAASCVVWSEALKAVAVWIHAGDKAQSRTGILNVLFP